MLILADLSFIPDVFSNARWEYYANKGDVTCMAVDSHHVWFGTETNGLFRWDKVTEELESFRFLDGYELSSINDLEFDRNGNLWIATNGSGVGKYDGMDLITYLPVQGSADTAYTISLDDSGNVWVGSNYGASRFDGNVWNDYTNRNSGIPKGPVRVITFDLEENIWFGTNYMVSRYDGSSWIGYSVIDQPCAGGCDRNGVMWFGGIFGHTMQYTGTGIKYQTSSDEGYTYDSYTTKMINDKTGRLLAGLYGGGLKKRGGMKWIVEKANSAGLQDNHVLAITIDPDSSIWLGTKAGLCVLRSFGWIRHNTNDFFVDRKIISISIDRNGTKWFGTRGGAVRCDNENEWFIFSDGNTNGAIPSYNIRDVVISPTGLKWVGSIGGLGTFNDVQWRSVLRNLDVNTISFDNRGNTWVGTDEGAYELDSLGAAILNIYTPNQGLTGDNVTAIAFEESGTGWFGTQYSSNYRVRGISKFDGTNWKTYGFHDGLQSDDINTIAIDNHGIKWFGSDEGLFSFDEVVWGFPGQSYDNNLGEVYALAIDGRGRIWAGGIKGLFIYDGTGFDVFTTANGLPHNTVNAIAFDSLGNAWIGTNNGIAVLYNQEVTSISAGEKKPLEYILLQNYPNPFNPVTKINYQINRNENVSLTIYNVLGQFIKKLVDQRQVEGSYSVEWDGMNSSGLKMPSGVYIYVLHTDSFTDAKRMILLR